MLLPRRNDSNENGNSNFDGNLLSYQSLTGINKTKKQFELKIIPYKLREIKE
jgi:hypothetical protein